MSEKSFASSHDIISQHGESANILLEYYAEFSMRILRARDFKTIVHTLYQELRKVYPERNAEILIWHHQRKLSRFDFDVEKNKLVLSKDPVPERGLYHYLIRNRRTVLTNNYSGFCREMDIKRDDLPAHSWLGVPLEVRGKILGALVLWDNSPTRFFRLQDKQLLTTIAGLVSFAIENVYLYEYIIEKNGVAKTDGQAPARLADGALTMKSALENLVSQISLSTASTYTGVYLRPLQKQQWRLLLSHHQSKERTGNLQKEFNRLPDILNASKLEAHKLYHLKHGSNAVVETAAFKDWQQRTATDNTTIFSFQVNDTYQGLVLTLPSANECTLSRRQQDTFLFSAYIIQQLLERRALLERKSRYEKHMQHLARLNNLGEMAGGTAHSVNNVLSVIIGKGQLLEKKLEGTPFQRDLQVLLQAAGDGAQSIRRLQEMGTKSGTTEPAAKISLNELLKEVVDAASPRFQNEAQSRGIHYDLKLSFGEMQSIVGEADQLRDVFLNLINNALDAMPRGGQLTIQTTMKEGKALVFVSDTGIGIPHEICDKIFEPFYTTKGKNGNGLGLSTSLQVISAHHGKIYVDSIPQKGTIFMIELPVSGHSRLPQPATEPEGAVVDYNVLIVEDQVIVRETLAELLSSVGCSVSTTPNAHEALATFRERKYDLVFTDLSMPEVNGIALARQLKTLNPETPVILVTGWNQIDPSLLNGNEIIDGIVKKPFEVGQIREEILRATSRHKALHRNGYEL